MVMVTNKPVGNSELPTGTREHSKTGEMIHIICTLDPRHAVAEAERRWGGEWRAVKLAQVSARHFPDVMNMGWLVVRKEAT